MLLDEYGKKSKDRLLSKIKLSKSQHYEGTVCWNWTDFKDKDGYGKFSFNGKSRIAHRISYELHLGKIPDGLTLDHLCRNTSCINPIHLEPTTSKENTMRGISPSAKNAAKTHCKRGHEYTPQNTWIVNSVSGKGRVCKICNRMRERELYKSQQEDLGKTVGPHGSAKTHCKKGHEFTEENTYITPLGRRQCNECQKQRKKKYKISIKSQFTKSTIH